MTLNLGFLCSHGGSNMEAIIKNVIENKLDANICVCISNNPDAFALTRAKQHNIPTYVINEKTYPNAVDNTIINTLKKHNANTIILAGYMKKLAKEVIDAFDCRVLNIHPALLPKYGGKGMYGMNIHKAVIDNGETITGATIHQVNNLYDDGRILAQKTIPILNNDTPQTIADKVLTIEHILYTETLIKIANNEIKFP